MTMTEPLSWHQFAFGTTDLTAFLGTVREDLRAGRTPQACPVDLLRLFLDAVLPKRPSHYGMSIKTFSVDSIRHQLASSDWKAVNARCRKLLELACRTFVELELGVVEVRCQVSLAPVLMRTCVLTLTQAPLDEPQLRHFKQHANWQFHSCHDPLLK